MSENTTERLRPTAGCHNDDEPLVADMSWPGYEWVCVVCETRYTYFGAKRLDTTPELTARYEELLEQWEKEKKS